MFGTLTHWQAYADARGNPAPADATPDQQSSALQRGDDYVRIHYAAQFAGDVDVASDGVAAALAEASYIAASLELDTPGLFSATFTPADQKALVAVGDLKWEVVQGSDRLSAAALAQPRSVAIDALLTPYMATATKGPGALIA